MGKFQIVISNLNQYILSGDVMFMLLYYSVDIYHWPFFSQNVKSSCQQAASTLRTMTTTAPRTTSGSSVPNAPSVGST